MPSVQATAVSWYYRRFVKPVFERDLESTESVRGFVERMDGRAPRPPRGTRVESMQLGECSLERITSGSSWGTRRVVLYLPGGGFVVRTPGIHRHVAARVGRHARAESLLVFYRLSPEHPFPAALEDCIRAYDHALELGATPSKLVIGGDSAGGTLTLATLMALRDRGSPMPAAAFTLSAVTDLRTHVNGSRTTNRESDAVISLEQSERWHVRYVSGNADRLADPLVSPLLGDFT